jgi:voltage-gated potassium channel Kch
MKNHAIVVGYKFLGKYVVDSLKSLGLEFIVIAKDNDQLEVLRKEGIAAQHHIIGEKRIYGQEFESGLRSDYQWRKALCRSKS